MSESDSDFIRRVNDLNPAYRDGFMKDFAADWGGAGKAFIDPELIRRSVVHLDPDVVPYEPTKADEQARLRLDSALPAPPHVRPSWDDYFMGLAFLASRRSPDLSTKHGCVIVDPATHHVLGTGYNGYEPGVDDHALATAKPKDYSLIRHSELNAVDNSTVDLRALGRARAYVTGQCCSDCAEHLAENGVRDWVMADRRGFSNAVMNEDARFAEIVARYGVSIRRTRPNLGWIVDQAFLCDLRRHGFLA